MENGFLSRPLLVDTLKIRLQVKERKEMGEWMREERGSLANTLR